VSVKKINKLN